MAGYRRRNSTIGLDYGTHSTKVVHRVRGEEMGRVLRFDRSCEGYPLNAAPSVMREIEGRLYFGTLAVELTGGIDYGSLKAELLGRTGDPGLDRQIDVLTSAYLAWAIGEIFDQDPQLAADNPILQVSAPTCHAGNLELKQRYLRIVHASYTYVQNHLQVEQGVELSWLDETLTPVLDATIPASSERRFFVAPETVAPMVSLQLEPFNDTGIFLIADMGAATTEMSVCAVNDETFGNAILAYSDSTESRGGSDLFEIDAMLVGPSQERLDNFLHLLKLQADKVWLRGYYKDKDCQAASRRWKKLQVLLTGGATHHPEVRKHFDKKVYPNAAWPPSETRLAVDRHYPTSLECDPGFEEEDLSLFAVANGLSVQLPLWPRFFNEIEIEELKSLDDTDNDAVPSYLEIG